MAINTTVCQLSYYLVNSVLCMSCVVFEYLRVSSFLAATPSIFIDLT